MSDALIYLTYLGVILLLGLVCTAVAKRLKLPSVLLLILAGIALNRLEYQGHQLINLPEVFLTSIGILSLVMVVFDSASNFKIKEFDKASLPAVKLTITFLLFCITLLSFSAHYLYGASWGLSVLFAALMAGTAADVVLFIMPETSNKLLQMLEVESIINTPIIVLIPFIMLDFIQSVQPELLMTRFIEQIAPFLQQIVTGIGAGVLIGLIILKAMKRWYSEKLSPLALTIAALLTYVLAENLGGNGVLAVTTMGLLFGSVYIKQKSKIMGFSSIFSNSLEILLFILVGFIVTIPLTPRFFIFSIGFFIIHLCARYFAVLASFRKKYSLREKLFITLNSPKGIAVAVVVFILATKNIVGMEEITDLVLAAMLYSIIVSSIVAKFSKYFIHREIIK
ncbi:MAG: cation:proton antiporter [Candidatus Woesearchaeota archaeon]